MALQIAITVPAQADPGEIVDILSTISNPNNNTLTIAWQTTAGDIDDDSAEDTSITVPETPTVIAVTCTITSDANETATATAYLTVGDPKANIYTPAVRIEIEGVDVTDRRIPRDGLVVGKSLDYPELLTFRSSGISFNLDNEDGDFDYNNPSNFFITQGLPAHGRGAKVLVRIGLSQSELIPVFAGEISEVITRLGDTKARIKARDLSVRSRQKVIENFGIEITRRITDFEGAALDYDALNAVFYFPIWGLPISRNSVSLTVHQGGSDISINVVEAIKTEGVLSNRNAEIDYARGLIRFEAPPDNAEATQITATWKRDYRYKRPDFLVRQLLKQTGVQSTLGITDDTDARFAIEQALVRHPTDRIFSSHGRPFFEKAGIVRWMMREADNAKRYMAQDNRLVEYDELQDKYTELAEAPTGGQSISNNFGDRLASETVNLPAGFTTSGQALAITDTRFYITTSLGTDDLYWFDRSGSQLGSFQVLRSGYQVQGLDIYNGFAYIAQNRSSGTKRIDVYNLATETIDTNKSFTVLTGSLLKGISVTAEYIYVLCSTSTADGQIKVYNHSGVEQTSLSFVFTRTQVGSTFGTSHGITTSSTHIIIVEQVTNQVMVRSFFYNGTEDTNRSFSILANVDDPKGLDSVNSRLYVLDADSRQINVYFIGGGEDRPFIPVRFDTHDFEDIYCLCTQSLAGDASQDIVVNPVAVYKYDKSADTWTVVLDADDGEPQLAHPYQGVYEDPFSSDFTPLADNRKNFQVVRRSNKTLIFYRRVESSQSSIAVYNETDDMITNIHTTAHSVGDGLPYSMDFALDIRNGGIYVYSFVVYYSATNSTLRLYRERFSVESQRYTETITRVDDSDGNAQYAVSVSDVILNDADGKWYFVLTWAAEGTGTGKAELCTIAKDGGGSRTVLKTYDDPTLSARSPAEMDGRFFYVEGGWVRREKTSTDDDVPAEEHYYPNEGGTLIEIESNNDITDHGVIWRSAKKADSPETESDVYDGWGLHNAVVSNMIVDDRDNLHVVAGYGLPYDIENNSPLSRTADSIPDETNFNWIQFGQDLATKIASCPTNGTTRLGVDSAARAVDELGNRIQSRDEESRCRSSGGCVDFGLERKRQLLL